MPVLYARCCCTGWASVLCVRSAYLTLRVSEVDVMESSNKLTTRGAVFLLVLGRVVMSPGLMRVGF